MRVMRSLKSQTDSVEERTEQIFALIDESVMTHVDEASSSLDELVSSLRSELSSGNISSERLNYYIMSLPVEVYYLTARMETVGIKSDATAMSKKEIYNKLYSASAGKTIKDKEAEVENKLISENLVEQAYKRAYKVMQHKVEQAENLLQSAKKVLGYRVSEMEMNGQENAQVRPKNSRR